MRKKICKINESRHRTLFFVNPYFKKGSLSIHQQNYGVSRNLDNIHIYYMVVRILRILANFSIFLTTWLLSKITQLNTNSNWEVGTYSMSNKQFFQIKWFFILFFNDLVNYIDVCNSKPDFFLIFHRVNVLFAIF